MSVEEIIHAAKRKAIAELPLQQPQPRANVYYKKLEKPGGGYVIQVFWRSPGRDDCMIYASNWFRRCPPYNDILADVYRHNDFRFPDGKRLFGFLIPLCVPRELVVFWWMVTDIEMPWWFTDKTVDEEPSLHWMRIPDKDFNAWLKLLRFTGKVPTAKIPWESEEARAKSKLRF